jgi:hypothetical protein
VIATIPGLETRVKFATWRAAKMGHLLKIAERVSATLVLKATCVMIAILTVCVASLRVMGSRTPTVRPVCAREPGTDSCVVPVLWFACLVITTQTALSANVPTDTRGPTVRKISMTAPTTSAIMAPLVSTAWVATIVRAPLGLLASTATSRKTIVVRSTVLTTGVV